MRLFCSVTFSSVAQLVFGCLLLASTPQLFAQAIPTGLQVQQQANNVLRYDVQFGSSQVAQGFVEYVYWTGLDSVHKNTGVTDLGTSHSLTVLGLQPQTTYRMRAWAFDAMGCNPGPWSDVNVAALPPGLTLGHVTSLTTVAGELPGYLLSNTAIGDPNRYLQIHDRRGNLVWYERMPGYSAANLDGPCQHFSYQPNSRSILLTTCAGVSELALDGSVLHDFPLGSVAPGWMPHHDLTRIPNGNLLVLAARVDTIDKSSVGGDPNALVVGPGILELAPNGSLLWSWSAFDHYDPLTSPGPGGDWVPKFGAQAIDWMGANSLMQDGDGNPMLNFGGTSNTIKVVRSNGSVVWTVGPQGSIEVLPPDSLLKASALRRSRPGYYLSFDNQGLDSMSRAVEWWIDFSYINPRVEISWQHVLPIADFSPEDGNVDRLPNGNFVIASNGGRSITEITAGGSILWNAVLDSSLYRAYWVDDFYLRSNPRFVGDTLICATDSLVPLVATVAGGIWSGDFVQGDTFFAALAGSGTHPVTYKLGPESFEVLFAVDPSLACGVGRPEPRAAQLAIEIFPNPSHDAVNLAWQLGRADRLHLQIHGLQGRLLHTQDLGWQPTGQGLIHLAASALGLPRGTYVLSLRSQAGLVGHRILVIQ